jgi:anti-sigma regulatory factor (Ser/Thr protein kinase)
MHGSGAIDLRAAISDGCLRVEVRDAGPGFRPAEPGYGLTILDGAMDRWGVADDEGTVVWFEADL